MPTETAKQTPPYIPFATFINFVSGLGESGVPDQIDSSLMRNLSGSARSGLMMALRYLNLIDENDNTSDELEKLATSTDQTRAPLLKGLLQNAYPFLKNKGFDLTRATPAQLAEAIGSEGATGGTRDKAVAFFLRAAEAAGLTVSAHILKGKHARTATGTKRAKRVVKKSNHKGNEGDPTPPLVAQSLAQQLIAIMDEEKMSKEEMESVWTLLKYLRKEGK